MDSETIDYTGSGPASGQSAGKRLGHPAGPGGARFRQWRAPGHPRGRFAL